MKCQPCMGLYIDRLLSAASLVVIILLHHTGNRKNLHGLALPDYKSWCNRRNYELAGRTVSRWTANLIILRFFFHYSFSTEKEMKAILLYTAALFAVSSALPFYENLKNQQTSNLCVSLSYSPSSDTAFSYVHVCNTPGEGKYAQSFPIRHPLPARLFVLRPHVFSSLARLKLTTSDRNWAWPGTLLLTIFVVVCRYMRLVIYSKMHTGKYEEPNEKDCNNWRSWPWGSVLYSNLWTR